MILGNFSIASYFPLAPFIKSEFILDSAQVGLITSIEFIGFMTVSLLSGFFVDRLGSNTGIKVSFGIIAIGALIIISSKIYFLLILGYFIVGFGYGIIVPSTNDAIMREYQPYHAPRMGIKQTGIPLGAASATIVLPLLAIHFSIRASFLLIMVVAISIALFVPRSKQNQSLKSVGKGYLRDLVNASRDKSLLVISGTVLFLSWGQQSLLTFYVLFEEYKGFSIIQGEAFLALLLFGSMIGILFWSVMIGRIFRKKRIRTLYAITLSSGILFILMSFTGNSLLLTGIFAFVIGMNSAGWSSPYVTLISEIAPKSKVGLYSGLSLMIVGIGTIVGTPVSGLILDASSYRGMWMTLGFSLMVITLIFYVIAMRRFTERKDAVATQ